MWIKVIAFALLVSFAIFRFIIQFSHGGWNNYWKAIAKMWKEWGEETNPKNDKNVPDKSKIGTFRINRIEYPRKGLDGEDKTPLIVYYAQKYGRKKWVDGFTAEYNNNEWWSLCKDRSGNHIFIYPYMGGGHHCFSEEDALQLIEDYKKEVEKEILEKPIREKRLKEGKEFLDKLQKEIRAEALKNAPKITHKYI
jgi:hypothetical protein